MESEAHANNAEPPEIVASDDDVPLNTLDPVETGYLAQESHTEAVMTHVDANAHFSPPTPQPPSPPLLSGMYIWLSFSISKLLADKK
jgi:hypothetical protein